MQAQADLQRLQAAVQSHLPQEQTVRIRHLEALQSRLAADDVSQVGPASAQLHSQHISRAQPDPVGTSRDEVHAILEEDELKMYPYLSMPTIK